MTGLSILYAKEAKEEKGWEKTPDREKPGRLREVYWARRAEKLIGGESFLSMSLNYQMDRKKIGRKRDDPGDDFIYKVKISTETESSFEWIEVTEVFTTTHPKEIEDAMKAWNCIENKQKKDMEKLRKKLKRGIPRRRKQREAADKVIEAIKKKTRKTSYNEVVEKYGYGTLVIGMPLWFAVLPAHPFRAENSLDDFVVRTSIGIEEIRRNELRKKQCPFKHLIVLWDTTPEAIKEWDAKRSREYEDIANTTLMNPLPATILPMLSELSEKTTEQTGFVESELPSCSFHLGSKVKKEKIGKGPYPDTMLKIQEIAEEWSKKERKDGMVKKLRQRLSLELCKVICFIKIHGVVGLERWAARRISPKQYWRRKATALRALRLYRESVRRAQKRKGRVQK